MSEIPNSTKIEERNQNQAKIFNNVEIRKDYHYELQNFLPDYQNLNQIIQYYLSIVSSQNLPDKNQNSSDNSENTLKNKQNTMENAEINPYYSGNILINASKGHELVEFFYTLKELYRFEVLSCDFIELLKQKTSFDEIINQFNFSSNMSGDGVHLVVFELDRFSDLISPYFTHQLCDTYASLEEFLFHFGKFLAHFSPVLNKSIFIFIMPLSSDLNHYFYSNIDLTQELPIISREGKKNLISKLIPTKYHNEIDFDHLSLQFNGLSRAEIRQFVKNILFTFEMERGTGKKGHSALTSEYIIEKLERVAIFQKAALLSPNNQGSPNDEISLKNPKPYFDYTGYISHEFEQQLYQNLASQNYTDTTILLDKLTKGIVLQAFERQILADNPFLLREEPPKALNKLNKAKITIDKIKHIPFKPER